MQVVVQDSQGDGVDMSDKGKDVNDHEETESLWCDLSWSIPVAVLTILIFAVPMRESGSQLWTGIALATFLVGKTVLDHYWPRIKNALIQMGVPAWWFGEDWRSNTLQSALFALPFTLLLHFRTDTVDWIQPMPFHLKFAMIFATLCSITWLGRAIHRWAGLP